MMVWSFTYSLECEVKWALGSITRNKASGGDGILAELFQILKDDAVQVLHSLCQKIWKTQQRSQDWSRSVVSSSLRPMDCSLSGFSIHGTFRARVLEWVAISFSSGSSRPRDRTQVSHTVGSCFTLWATWEATRLEQVNFHSKPKERQCQRMFKLPYNCTHFIC